MGIWVKILNFGASNFLNPKWYKTGESLHVSKMENVVSVLEGILSPDNGLRKQAEVELEEAFRTNPASLVNDLYACSVHEIDDVARLAWVVFKKNYLEDQNQTEQALTHQNLKEIAERAFEIVNLDRSLVVLHAQGSLLVKLYAKIDNLDPLLQKIIEYSENDSWSSRELAMFMLEIIAEIPVFNNLVKLYSDSFNTIFSKGLDDSVLKVKIAALKATWNFISFLNNKEIVWKFMNLIDIIIETVLEALENDEKEGRLSLESLIDIAEYHPELFKNVCSRLVTLISKIVANKTFHSDTRSNAKEVLLSLAEKAPTMLRSIENIKSEFFPSLFEMLTEVTWENDIKAWAKEREDYSLARTDTHTIAREALIRLSKVMGEETTFSASSSLIQTNITSTNWKQKQAAFYYWGYISIICKKKFKQNLEEILQTVLEGITHENSRIQYSALSCLALLLTEQSPNLQKLHHSKILPTILTIM
jgi:hypothetical protein